MKTRATAVGVVGGVLVVEAVVALLNPLRWTWVGDRPWLWLFVAAAGFAAVGVSFLLLMLARPGPLRVPPALAVVCLLLVALAVGGLGLFGLALHDRDVRVVARSGDGRFEIIVHDTSNVIDPVDGLYVQTTGGPFSKRAYLGCFNSESGHSFGSARFAETGTVILNGTKQWTVRFDATDVRTVDTVEEGACTRQLYTG
ncbi:hypothetical protein [Kibdelosporangium phytohabitans]|uniref:Uncharacterized protein n=1 Tax=Kibdelosporangium phytohabitans TaxID=860235 RepID=A0A0N9I421_9PSEU|nr:hypothetical protein [Kibdelosporangium phytohabitans]ALG09076.1 hypothetical protein AOZ06_21070 [Kibdelosporangium phytohabitans]MBE1469732.1 hypothetical protein [Kibdelosporangium phytohabitans]